MIILWGCSTDSLESRMNQFSPAKTAFVMYASLPAIRQMTSVLYSSGLNYQGRNPMGNEIRGLERRVTEIEESFGGVKGQMEQFLTGQSGGASEASKKVSEMKAQLEVQQKELDGKIGELKGQLDSIQALFDVLKTRVDRGDAAIASATSAANQAKALATNAAADAASAAAAAAAASAGSA